MSSYCFECVYLPSCWYPLGRGRFSWRLCCRGASQTAHRAAVITSAKCYLWL